MSTAVGLVLKGFQKMENEGISIESTLPLKHASEKEEEPAEEAPVAEEVAPQPEETKKKKKGFSFKNLINTFNSENMFKQDNDA